MSDWYLKVGSEVEVITAEHSLFLAKIIARESSKPNRLLVEYKTVKFMKDHGVSANKPLREKIDSVLVRPLPPCETHYKFRFGDNVDVFFNGGWSEGWITGILDGKRRYGVYIRFLKEQLVFGMSDLRLHRKWVNGAWAPALRDEEQKRKKHANNLRKYSEGTAVEVSSKEDGFQGAWFEASIVKAVGKSKFLVKYKKLRTDDDEDFVTEKVDKENIRPYPPEAVVVDGFSVNEEVEASCNDGWWEGVITKLLSGGRRYRVYFKGTKDEAEFQHSELRLHHRWIHGTWVMA